MLSPPFPPHPNVSLPSLHFPSQPVNSRRVYVTSMLVTTPSQEHMKGAKLTWKMHLTSSVLYTSRVLHCSCPVNVQTCVGSPQGSAVTCAEGGTVTHHGRGMGENGR